VAGDKLKDLQNVDYKQVAEDAKNYAREKPGQALLISAAAGLPDRAAPQEFQPPLERVRVQVSGDRLKAHFSHKPETLNPHFATSATRRGN
jgi:hypothetical protein